VSEPDILVCIGNLTVDEAVSAAGQHVESVGGDALFAALAARFTGAPSIVLAPLGHDAPPAMLAALRSAGTDPATLPRRAAPTVRNIVRYDAAGGRAWELVLGEHHFDELSVHPGDVSAEALSAAGILVSGMALSAQLELAGWLREHTSAVIFFDPQEDYIAGNETELREAVAHCDVFLPSEIEAVALAGTADLRAAARFFLDLGPHTVVIKRAEAGCLVATSDGQSVELAADVVNPVDSTGAGDAFCGGFAAHYLSQADPIEAARAGMAAATIALSGNGIDGLLAALDTAGQR
jgi:ribokinase